LFQLPTIHTPYSLQNVTFPARFRTSGWTFGQYYPQSAF
jgi:hypothetical protein